MILIHHLNEAQDEEFNNLIGLLKELIGVISTNL
jgi:hypothetical protein